MVNETLFQHAKLLIVDDKQVNLILLERILRDLGYKDIASTQDPRDVPQILETSPIDLIITDYRMPHLNGLALIKQLRSNAANSLPIILASSEITPDLEEKALDAGVTDFLPKPFSRAQARSRISNLLLIQSLSEELTIQNERLELEIRKRTKDLQQAHLEALERLALAAEYRDYMTGRHTQRVGLLSARIASELGLPEDEIDLIKRAAPLHDVGKIGIPDSILLKPGKLTYQEFEVMKTHVQLGLKLLSPNTSRLVQMAKLIALTHHERWDGSGYPNGLEGKDIPIVGQIVAIADVYDALVSKRPYKEAWKVAEAIDEIKNCSGSWFSPDVVDAFLHVAGHPDNSGDQSIQS